MKPPCSNQEIIADMYRFAHPIWLLLLIVPAWTLISFFIKKGRTDPTVIFADVSIFTEIGDGNGLLKRVVSLFITVAAISTLIFAMGRLQSGQSMNIRTARGIDIILAMDISSSMEAMNFDPLTRFEASKEVVSAFISNRTNDCIGLVLFAAQSFTLCPLTLDYEMLGSFLERAGDARIDDGTAIGSAIATSVNRLRDSDAKSRIIILLTDGMNNRGNLDPLTAARIAQTLGIRVYTIGVGTEGQAPIKIDGRIMITETHIDEDTLKEVAKITGGKYYRAKNTRQLMGIYSEIDKLETTEIKYTEWVEYKEMYPGFLKSGFILLVLLFLLNGSLLRRLP